MGKFYISGIVADFFSPHLQHLQIGNQSTYPTLLQILLK